MLGDKHLTVFLVLDRLLFRISTAEKHVRLEGLGGSSGGGGDSERSSRLLSGRIRTLDVL